MKKLKLGGKTRTVNIERRKLPQPIRTEQRICFGIMWFATKKDADLAAADVERRGVTYNGGMYHGRPCGRDESFDRKDGHGNVIEFAVTY